MRIRWSLGRMSRWLARGLTATVVMLGLFIGFRWWTGNHGVVIPGQVYRAGQLSGGGLAETLRRHRIKTVLNLRGANPEETWYQAERAATLASGATQVDVALASDLWLSRDQARILVDLLESCERPILLHCQWGAERSGLVSAIVELLRPGGSLATARSQFAMHYLFLPTEDGRIMQAHVNAYAAWIQGQGLEHHPDRFRQWLLDAYRPGSPSREEWPYDPYPLAVITRPDREPVTITTRQEPLTTEPSSREVRRR